MDKKAHLAAAGKEWVDCNAKGVSKWTALSYLIDRFDLLPDEVCCFGDNLNDIEMLQNAGISYAVSNARQEVIAAANTPVRLTGKTEYLVFKVYFII